MELLNLTLTKALGIALFHSIWQGTLIALIMSILLSLVKRRHAKTRYLISLSALFLMFLLFLSTFFQGYENTKPEVSGLAGLTNEIASNDVIILSNDYGWVFQMKEFLLLNIQWISIAWAVGMALFVFKVLFGLRFTSKVKKSSRAINVPWVKEILEKSKVKAQYNRFVLIKESLLVHSPSVIGFLKPCIYFPIGLMNNLSETEVEAIIAHELAHIIRNDFLVNIIQSFIESLFYFHPAVWWISANIRVEREHACDDLAIRIIGDNLKYAKSLVYLQELEKLAAPSLAMSFSNRETPLFERIKRILNQPKNKHDMKQKTFASIILLSSIIWISATDAHQQNDELREPEYQIAEIIPLQSEPDFAIATDTIPAQIQESKSTIIELKNGKIKRLEIDGVEIPESDFDAHENIVEELQMDRLPELDSDHFYVFPQHNEVEVLLERSQEHLNDFLAGIEINSKTLEPLLEKNLDRVFDLTDELDKKFEFHAEELDALYDKIDEDLQTGNKYYYECNDSLKSSLDSFKIRMGDFHFDFDEMAEDVRIFVDSLNLPEIRDDVFIFLDSLNFRDIGNDIRIQMDSFQFPELDSDFRFGFDNNLESAYLRALKDDGLYEINGNEIMISMDSLVINGKVQSEQMLEKYLSIYERKTGTKLLNGSNIHLEIDNSSKNKNYKRI